MSESQIYVTKAPPQHADLHMIDAAESYLFGSRGSLKTWLACSLFVLRRVYGLPKSTGAIIGITFEHLMDNTLPPIKSFLASRGINEGEHYVLFKPPPDHWPKPYSGVLDPKYKHAWTWSNGTTIQLISLRRKASANGVSAQWALFDECKFMDPAELEDEIFPIIRPLEISHPLFKDKSGYLSKFFSTDKKADPANIRWLIDKRDLVDHRKVELVKSLQEHVLSRYDDLQKASKTTEPKIKKEIFEDELRLAKMRSKLIYVAEINADDVRPILGDKWYADKKRNTTKYDWDIIYLNKDPDKPSEPFYPGWNSSVHVYDIKNDIDLNIPFIIAGDYQHSIAPITIAQISTLPGRDRESLNYVDEVHTKPPKGLRAAVKKFCEKHKSHVCKQVYYVYDHTAVADRVDAETYKDIVINELELNDWTVWPIYTGQAPDHYQKHADTIEWMEHTKDECMEIRVNKRCRNLISSIEAAPAMIVGKETKKDKRGERNPKLDQAKTTHFSDAFDMKNDAVLKKRMISVRIAGSSFGFR